MWTQNKLFHPQNPRPEPESSEMPRQQPTILTNELTAGEIARMLAALAFNQAQDRKRTVQMSRLARDKIVAALELMEIGNSKMGEPNERQ